MPLLKAIELKIVKAQVVQEAEDQVNSLISKDGWTLHGDLKVVCGASGNLTYVQALVKVIMTEPPGMSPLLGGPPVMLAPRR